MQLFPVLSLNESSVLLVTNVVSQLNYIAETFANLVFEMNRLASLIPEYSVVTNMFGVGSVLSSQLIIQIGDVSRLYNKHALVAFAGLGPLFSV